MSELPKGWVQTKFTDTLDVNGGTQPPKSQFVNEPQEGYIRLLQIRDFGKKPVPTYIPDNGKRRICKKEDILIGRYGASIGRICTGMEGAFNVALARVAKPKDINSGYLKYFLQSHLFQDPLSMLSRSAQNGFNKQDLAEFNFPIAPINEQNRIADKLDSMLAKVDAAQARLDKIPNILKRFRQSVLAAATSGELTKEWREENKYKSVHSATINWNVLDKEEAPHDIPSNWIWQHVGDIIEVFNSKRKPLKQADRDKRSGEYPYYGAFGIIDDIDGFLFDGRYLLLAEDGKNLESRQRPISLIADGRFWVNNHAHVIQGKEGIKLDYLKYFFNSPTIEIDQFLTGMDQVKLNKNSMIKIPMPVPPEKEQQEIIRRVESLFSMADTVEKQFLEAKARTNRLTQSVLAKAFRGELVPQDSNDEPASKLLARIQIQQAKLQPAKTKNSKVV